MICSGSKLPMVSKTASSESPIGISYEIIWAVARRPPKNEYLLFEAQPPRVMPYTPRDAAART